MKRFFAALLAAMLVLTMFAGCSAKESPVAYKVGNMEFTVEDMNYMYVSSFNEIYNNLYYTYANYGIDISTIVDITKPLDEQMVNETTSWHQYILDYAANTAKTFAGIYEKAIEANFVLGEEYQADLDTFEEQLDEVAASNEMTRDEYLYYMYGENVSLDTVKKMTEFRYITMAYAQQYETELEISDEDIKAYYEANKQSLDKVDFRYYTSYYEEAAEETAEEETEKSSEETAEEVTEEEPTEEATSEEETAEETTEETTEEAEKEKVLTQEEAKAQADTLAEVHTAEEFNALALEYTTDEIQKKLFGYGDATLLAGSGYDSTGIEEVSKWLFDEARQYGDTMVYHDEEYKSYLTIMFEERVEPDYNCIDVRHILVKAEADENEDISDEEWERVKAEADEILNAYLAGEQTEEAFGELAKEHSDDGNAAQGGIYENVNKGMMVSNFDDWCFDSSRKPGDTGLVITPFGMHVMYFVGIGDNYLESTVKPILADEKLNTWVADCSVNLTEEKTEAFDEIGGMIDDIVLAAQEKGSEKEKDDSKTGVIIAMLVVVIIVCVVIIIKKKTEKPAEPAEETLSEEATEEAASEGEEAELSEEEELPEATDEDLTEEELFAEEAFEEAVTEEEPAEETSEETEK
ncbi:MAG: peptidylprolyl isomerase [Oscillospiraceae bacterium]|nr:peptidylprolyl isomerase [Oscillospiraceae bacterium]